MEQLKFSYTADGRVKMVLWKIVVSIELPQIYHIGFNHSTSMHLPLKNENVCSLRRLIHEGQRDSTV